MKPSVPKRNGSVRTFKNSSESSIGYFSSCENYTQSRYDYDHFPPSKNSATMSDSDNDGYSNIIIKNNL